MGFKMEFSKEKKYLIKGREGQYELTTEDKKHHCFFMDDKQRYEYFSVNVDIAEVQEKIKTAKKLEINGVITKEEYDEAKKFRHGILKKAMHFFDKNWNVIR